MSDKSKSAPKLKAEDVKEALRRRHGYTTGSGEWVCVEEAFSGWKTWGGGIDLLAIGVWQTAKAPGLPGAGALHGGEKMKKITSQQLRTHPDNARHPIVAYEVKVSRSDYKREVNGYKPGPNAKWGTRSVGPWPYKAQFALRASHYFMFATPKGLLKPEEIARRQRPQDGKGLWLPPEAGLIEVDGRGCNVVVAAPRRAAPEAFDRGEIAELLRHALDPNQLRQMRQQLARTGPTIQGLQQALAKLEDEKDLLQWKLGAQEKEISKLRQQAERAD